MGCTRGEVSWLASHFFPQEKPVSRCVWSAVGINACFYVFITMCFSTSQQETGHPSRLWWYDRTVTMTSLISWSHRVCVSEYRTGVRCCFPLFASSLSCSLSTLPGGRGDGLKRLCVCVCICTVCAVRCEFPVSPIDKTYCDSPPLISLLDQTSDHCCCCLLDH